MADFPMPSFLEGHSVDENYERMIQRMPDDFDKSEGSHVWNLTRPQAYEQAYWAEYIMPEAIKLIFPRFSENYAEIMEYHAETRGLQRKQASYATGDLEIKGKEDTEIPEDTAFSTLSINGEPSVEFRTTENAVIGSSGVVTVHIKAAIAGTSGNVPKGTIIGKLNKISGITCTNPKPTTGGTEEESIESLQARIIEYDMTKELSYGGSEADYKRWALSVNGTGGAIVIHSKDDTEPITIVLTDANGDPANTDLCNAVYNYIMRPDVPIERLAPINDRVKIVPPETVNITISATIELEDGGTIIEAKKAFMEAIKAYFVEAAEDEEIRYTKVGAVLSDVAVVADYKNLLINGATDNIAITNIQLAHITEEGINFTSGTV